MDKLDKIEDALNKLYGHLAITKDRESALVEKGRTEGIAAGYKSGYEAGFSDGFNEGKIFPIAKSE